MSQISAQTQAASPRPPENERWTAPSTPHMLSPQKAWRALCRRTGGGISRATFYRWITNGKVYSVRLGFQIYIPQMALDDLVEHCLQGERF